jgi:two-component sensor histidine kinase
MNMFRKTLVGQVDEKKKLSLGLQLVDSLVAQLEGTLKIDRNDGASFKITFNDGIC